MADGRRPQIAIRPVRSRRDRDRFGDEAIRYSLLSMPVVIVIAAVFYWLATRTIAADVAKAQSVSSGGNRDTSVTQ